MNWSLHLEEPHLPRQKPPRTGPPYDDSDERMSPLGWLLESAITVVCIIRFEVPKLVRTLLMWCGVLAAALIFVPIWPWYGVELLRGSPAWDRLHPSAEEIREEIACCFYGILLWALAAAVWHFRHGGLSIIVLIVLGALYLVATWTFVTHD